MNVFSEFLHVAYADTKRLGWIWVVGLVLGFFTSYIWPLGSVPAWVSAFVVPYIVSRVYRMTSDRASWVVHPIRKGVLGVWCALFICLAVGFPHLGAALWKVMQGVCWDVAICYEFEIARFSIILSLIVYLILSLSSTGVGLFRTVIVLILLYIAVLFVVVRFSPLDTVFDWITAIFFPDIFDVFSVWMAVNVAIILLILSSGFRFVCRRKPSLCFLLCFVMLSLSCQLWSRIDLGWGFEKLPLWEMAELQARPRDDGKVGSQVDTPRLAADQSLQVSVYSDEDLYFRKRAAYSVLGLDDEIEKIELEHGVLLDEGEIQVNRTGSFEISHFTAEVFETYRPSLFSKYYSDGEVLIKCATEKNGEGSYMAKFDVFSLSHGNAIYPSFRRHYENQFSVVAREGSEIEFIADLPRREGLMLFSDKDRVTFDFVLHRLTGVQRVVPEDAQGF